MSCFSYFASVFVVLHLLPKKVEGVRYFFFSLSTARSSDTGITMDSDWFDILDRLFLQVALIMHCFEHLCR